VAVGGEELCGAAGGDAQRVMRGKLLVDRCTPEPGTL